MFMTSEFQTHTFLLTMSLYSFVCLYLVTKEAAKTLICYTENVTTIKGTQEKETIADIGQGRAKES